MEMMVGWRNPAPMCHCPVPLVVKWRFAGQWVQIRTLMDLDGDMMHAAWQDEEAFPTSGADAWAIGCPQCKVVYVGAIVVVASIVDSGDR